MFVEEGCWWWGWGWWGEVGVSLTRFFWGWDCGVWKRAHLKGHWTERASWLEQVENIQVFVYACFVWCFYQIIIHTDNNNFCVFFLLLFFFFFSFLRIWSSGRGHFGLLFTNGKQKKATILNWTEHWRHERRTTQTNQRLHWTKPAGSERAWWLISCSNWVLLFPK